MAGCSSPSPAPTQPKEPPAGPPGPATTTQKHPLAKYVEFAGFRLTEPTAGKLNVKFAAINHSEADLGELVVKIRLITTAFKPGDDAVAAFEAKIPSLGPHETKDVNVTASTKLRIYELPDWQFLRADFDITAPAP